MRNGGQSSSLKYNGEPVNWYPIMQSYSFPGSSGPQQFLNVDLASRWCYFIVGFVAAGWYTDHTVSTGYSEGCYNTQILTYQHSQASRFKPY